MKKLNLYIIIFVIYGCHLKPANAANNIFLEMKKIDIGDTIPDIVLKNQNGKIFDLKAETKGKNVVLYFYPMDNTKGCTAQACTFRDQFEDFLEANAVVIGISGQSTKSHSDFASKYKLPFTLLSDEDNKVRKMLGVPSSLLGIFPGRVTYVINKNHKVVYIFNSQFKIKSHIENSLRILNSN